MSSCTEKEDGDNGSKKVAVLGVRVDPESVVCAPGDVVPVKVTVLPENATDRSYTWSTGDGMVAVVEEGNIRAIAAGTTLLTVTTTDGGYTATCEVTVTESSTGGDEETVLMTRAGGYYFGDQWGTGYDNDYVYFLSGNVVQDNVSLSGDGMALWLDLNLPPTGATTVPEGTYIPLLEDDQDQSFTWSTGVDMGDWGIIGTFVYICESGGTPTYLMAEEGTVDISRSGSEYAVTADLTAGGRRFSFTYTGPIPLEDGRNLGGGDDYTTVELDGVFTHGEMDYYGQAYGDTGTDYANWTIYLAEDTFDFNTFDGTGHMLQLEVNTASSATREITPGTYEIFDVIEEACRALHGRAGIHAERLLPGYVVHPGHDSLLRSHRGDGRHRSRGGQLHHRLRVPGQHLQRHLPGIVHRAARLLRRHGLRQRRRVPATGRHGGPPAEEHRSPHAAGIEAPVDAPVGAPAGRTGRRHKKRSGPHV